jgi:hypothetical protein
MFLKKKKEEIYVDLFVILIHSETNMITSYIFKNQNCVLPFIFG